LPDTEQDITQAVGFTPDGRTLIAARATGIIQLWDIAERRRIATLGSDAESYGMAISSNGRFVASGGADAMVRVWDRSASLRTGVGKGLKPHPGAAPLLGTTD